MRVHHRVALCCVALATMLCAASAETADLIFEDGFGSGDLWAWSRMVNGSPAAGPCPCEYHFRGTTHYVDPAAGSDIIGDGSAGSPWASIQHVVDFEVDCTDQYGAPKNPGAPVKGGDRIVLVGAAGHDPALEITGNTFVNRYTTGQPAGSLGPTQCLSGFEDGPKQRLRITNNLCKADHWHGITWYDTNNSIVVNNTVIGGSDYPGLPPGSDSWPTRTWISVEGTGNIVRNNITTRNLSGGDHNLELLPADIDLYFTDWPGLDFTLAPGSPAIDAGSPDGATTHDILGAPRDALPDVGAYED